MMKFPNRIFVCCVLAVVNFRSVSVMMADTSVPLPKDTVKKNRASVEAAADGAFWKGKGIAVAAVTAMSGVRRTAGVFPEDGDFHRGIELIAAQGEYEPGSVELYAFSDTDGVLLEPGVLSCKVNGGKIDAREIDIKVVKVWYQQGTAWGSFFSDPLRRIATPELMVYDDALIFTDFNRKESFVRCDRGGQSAYRWLTFGAAAVDHSKDGVIKHEWIHDAEQLQPFPLHKDEFKQLMVTVHVPEKTPAGLYAGGIALKVKGNKLFDIPIKVRVLPFELPEAKTFRDLNRRYRACCEPWYPEPPIARPKVLANIARHGQHDFFLSKGNIIHSEVEAKIYKTNMETAGIKTDHLYCSISGSNVASDYPSVPGSWNYWKYSQRMQLVSNDVAAVKAVFGDTMIPTGYAIDEASPELMRAERSTWKGFNEVGAQPTVSCRWHPYMLFNVDFAQVPRQTRKWRRSEAEMFHAGNPDGLIGWYADPHSGPENPDYARRLYGWQTWRDNFDGYCQYILWRDNWTDFWLPDEANLRGLQIVYAQDMDIIDTLQWEGMREAMDDVRYGTLLRQIAEEARHSKDVNVQYAARAALTWQAQVDDENSELDYLRLETIRRILQLKKMIEGK